jgi:hypothetical protein
MAWSGGDVSGSKMLDNAAPKYCRGNLLDRDSPVTSDNLSGIYIVIMIAFDVHRDLSPVLSCSEGIVRPRDLLVPADRISGLYHRGQFPGSTGKLMTLLSILPSQLEYSKNGTSPTSRYE